MKQNTFRLMLFILVTTSIVLGFYAHQLDTLSLRKTSELEARLEAQIKSAQVERFKTALERARKSIVSIKVLPSIASPKRTRSDEASKDGSPIHLGSGIIESTDGLILTNTDVVEGYETVQVQTVDHSEFRGSVIATDELTGLAVVKINAKGLPAAAFGNPSENLPGTQILAIGFIQTANLAVKTGIIAGKPIPLSDDRFVPLIQADLPLSAAWSGGALVNLEGEIIGINMPVREKEDSIATGLTLSLPIDIALGLASELITNGAAQRGRLGIAVQALNQTLAKAFGLPGNKGALVSWVETEGPAGKAGLSEGDIILRMANNEILDAQNLPPLVAALKPGAEVNLSILRHKKVVDVTVRAGVQEVAAKSLPLKDTVESPSDLEFGLTLLPINSATLKKIGLVSGMKVKTSKSAGATAGILANDIVLAINGHQISTLDEFKLATTPPSPDYAVQIYRDGHIFYLGVHVETATSSAVE